MKLSAVLLLSCIASSQAFLRANKLIKQLTGGAAPASPTGVLPDVALPAAPTESIIPAPALESSIFEYNSLVDSLLVYVGGLQAGLPNYTEAVPGADVPIPVLDGAIPTIEAAVGDIQAILEEEIGFLAPTGDGSATGPLPPVTLPTDLPVGSPFETILFEVSEELLTIGALLSELDTLLPVATDPTELVVAADILPSIMSIMGSIDGSVADLSLLGAQLEAALPTIPVTGTSGPEVPPTALGTISDLTGGLFP